MEQEELRLNQEPGEGVTGELRKAGRSLFSHIPSSLASGRNPLAEIKLYSSFSSMMDPVSLTLGILPLVGGAIDIYKTVRSKFKVFCHYSAEVERVRKLFAGQRDYFLNEMELVLRLIMQDHGTVKNMMKNPRHSQWRAADLEEKLKAKLERNLDSFRDMVEDITEAMTKLQEAFRCFDLLEMEQVKDEYLRVKSPKDAIRTLRKRFKITFEKEKFESHITNLQRSNDGFRRLREQVSELQKPSYGVGRLSPPIGAKLPAQFSDFSAIRRASKALHEALMGAWSSTHALDLRHSVRLFIDAKADQDVLMEVAIMCHAEQIIQEALVQTSLIRLEVRSRTMDAIAWANASMVASASEMNSALSCEKNTRKKRRMVTFAGFDQNVENGDDGATARDSATPIQQPTAPSSDNLRLAGHFCPELSRRSIDPNLRCAEGGLGHIDTCSEETFRHWFYPCSNGPCRTSVCLDDVVLVDEILDQPVHTRMTIVSQLRLAQRLASAVLKFNSTPWLNELWTVRDLAFFRQGEDLTTSLQTLHFGIELAYSQPSQASSVMEIELPTTLTHMIEDAQYKHGVRNITLYSLGVALLTVGRWERVDPNDIEGVRRLAAEPCYLGRAYQELTQKVLDCDFGYGKDLKKPRLQEAVYETVILELDSMITKLDLAGS